jgi:hypothetical protein
MLGQPVAAVAPGLGMPGEVERVVQRVGRCRPLRDGRKIENGKRYHRDPTSPGKRMLQLLIAVESTARAAYEPGYSQVFVEDATTSISEEVHLFFCSLHSAAPRVAF